MGVGGGNEGGIAGGSWLGNECKGTTPPRTHPRAPSLSPVVSQLLSRCQQQRPRLGVQCPRFPQHGREVWVIQLSLHHVKRFEVLSQAHHVRDSLQDAGRGHERDCGQGRWELLGGCCSGTAVGKGRMRRDGVDREFRSASGVSSAAIYAPWSFGQSRQSSSAQQKPAMPPPTTTCRIGAMSRRAACQPDQYSHRDGSLNSSARSSALPARKFGCRNESASPGATASHARNQQSPTQLRDENNDVHVVYSLLTLPFRRRGAVRANGSLNIIRLLGARGRPLAG